MDESITVRLQTTRAKGHEYWVLRWYDGETGKRRGETVGRVDKITKPKAERRRARKEVDLEVERATAGRTGTAPTLAEWCQQFMELKRSEQIAKSTERSYEFAIRILKQHFGERRRLDRITRNDAKLFAAAVRNGNYRSSRNVNRETGMTRVTADRYLSRCRTIFKEAADCLPQLPANPFTAVKLARVQAQRWTYVTPEVFWKLYTAASPGWQTVLALCRLAGLRRGDALAVKWGNINWREGILDISQQKTGRRCQPPICPELRKVLKSLTQPTTLDDRVVPQPVGVDNLDRDFRKLCKKAKVSYYAKPLHSLRKSCIDDWAKAGYPPSVVQQWAGHADIKTTMTFYSQVDARDVKRASERSLFG
jgi:integrase